MQSHAFIVDAMQFIKHIMIEFDRVYENVIYVSYLLLASCFTNNKILFY